MLSQEMNRAGVSNAELARRAGLNPSYVSQLRRGVHKPGRKIAGRLYECLDIPSYVGLLRAGYLPPLEEKHLVALIDIIPRLITY